MTQLDWYIDFLSPFPYLQLHRFSELPDHVVVRPKPVLFAGLLKHWGHKGPADIPPKRDFVFRHAMWQANRAGIPLRLPPAHPFSPLRPLRLAIALGSGLDSVGEILRFIWNEGRDTATPENWRELVGRLGLGPDEADAAIARPEVKEALRKNTEEAIAAGVFGVPTMVAQGNLFWGADATGLLVDYLADADLLQELDRQLAGAAPGGISRAC